MKPGVSLTCCIFQLPLPNYWKLLGIASRLQIMHYMVARPAKYLWGRADICLKVWTLNPHKVWHPKFSDKRSSGLKKNWFNKKNWWVFWRLLHPTEVFWGNFLSWSFMNCVRRGWDFVVQKKGGKLELTTGFRDPVVSIQPHDSPADVRCHPFPPLSTPL